MANAATVLDGRYTWNDYQTWPDKERWELISGETYDMSSAPGTRHQIVAGALHATLLNHFSGQRCLPFIAPTDVKLSAEDVVQPDTLRSVVFDYLELPLEGVFDFPLEPGEVGVVKESLIHYVTHEIVQGT